MKKILDSDKMKLFQERLERDYLNQEEVGKQSIYANKIKKDLNLGSFSASTFSREANSLGFVVVNGKVRRVDEGLNHKTINKKELINICSKQSIRYKILSDSIILVIVNRDYSYTLQKNLKELFAKFILSIFTNEDGHLLIITNHSSGTDEIKKAFINVLNINHL